MTKFFNFALKIKGGGREGGRCRDSKKPILAQAETLLRHFWGICILRD